MLLNKDVLARDPAEYRLADGGVAKVSFPPDSDQKAILREQLQTFVGGLVADQTDQVFQYLAHLEGKVLKAEPVCLDLGNVENIVDEVK